MPGQGKSDDLFAQAPHSEMPTTIGKETSSLGSQSRCNLSHRQLYTPEESSLNMKRRTPRGDQNVMHPSERIGKFIPSCDHVLVPNAGDK